ncbi:MAG: NADP-dependent oxidoreductase [Pseudomonadota bacterium]
MKAVYYEEFGSADILKLGEQPKPEPGPDQVLVKVAATSVNPIDRRLRSGELKDFFQYSWPVIPGWDVAGRIEAVGEDVEDFQVGDDVVGLGFTWSVGPGAYAEYMAIDETAIAKKPANLTWHEAASLPLVNLTAWQSLNESYKVQPGDSVFIQAGAGGIGSVAIPIAKHLGAKVYTTTRSKNFDYVTSRGADVPIDYKRTNYVHVLKEHEPDGVSMTLETLEDKIYVENAIRVTKAGGAVIYMNNEPPEMPEKNDKGIHAEWVHHRPDGAMLQTIMDLYGNGTFTAPKMEVMGLEDAAEAHRKSESWRTNGKMVLHVQDI